VKSSEQLQIAYLIQDFPPEIGAGPARVTEMSHRWQALGARVTAITAMPNRRIPGRGEGSVDPRYRGRLFMEEDWEGIRTLRSWLYAGDGRGLRTKLVNNATFMMTAFLNGLRRREHFDVMIASSPPFLPHVSAALLHRLRRFPLVLEVRDLWPDYLAAFGLLGNRMLRRSLFGLERWLFAQADHVVVVTDSFRERVIDKGVPRERIDVIPNGVAVDQYYRSDEPPPLPELEKSAGEFVVGYLGTFGKGQGLESVIRAAASLSKTAPGVRFVLAGDGPEMLRVLEEIRLTRPSNVSIHAPIMRSQTRAFYNACDVCLVPLAPIPIFNETVPSKIFEVMACERPLIGCVGGEAGAVITRSGGGIRTEPGDHAALAAAILEMRSMDETERRAMGRRAREYVAANYDRTNLADRYLKLLETVAARRHSTRVSRGR
jgi:glycosyltransferase involved in cell wall biosynthesis